MRQIHTMAKKARRASSFRSMGAHDTPWGSRFEKREYRKALRRAKREHLQAKQVKPFGQQIIRTQRVFLRRDKFNQPVFKTIYHAAEE